MVAHDIADVPLLFAVMVRRRTSFQEDPSIVFLTLGAVHRATQQGRGGAMLRGGSFDQSGGCQELHGEWRMCRVAELSSADFQEVEGIHKRPPTCLESVATKHVFHPSSERMSPSFIHFELYSAPLTQDPARNEQV